MARLESPTITPQVLEQIVGLHLRSTDAVERCGAHVLAAIAGDEQATLAALGRVLSLRVAADLDVHLVPADDPEYERVVHLLRSRSPD